MTEPGGHQVAMAVRDDTANHRYVIDVDSVQAGLAVYHLRGGRHFFVHTEVDNGFAGRGVGAVLARGALDDVMAQGGSVVPLCPFIAAYISRHPEYDEMVDWELLEQINKGDQPPDA